MDDPPKTPSAPGAVAGTERESRFVGKQEEDARDERVALFEK